MEKRISEEPERTKKRLISEELKCAKRQLISEQLTCVLCSEDRVYTSTLRGVKPLVQWLEQGIDVKGFCAADKVAGKATAFLYVLLGVKAVYAKVISKSALHVLREHHIYTEYEVLTDHIINRSGDGICPFEEAVLCVEEPYEAYAVIMEKLREFGTVTAGIIVDSGKEI